MRRLPGEESIEHRAQGIDIGCGALGRAAHLLGAGIVRRQQTLLRKGLVGRGSENPGDPEIQQLRLASRVNQNVGRLDVAVDDQVAVGVSDRVAYFEEQAKCAAQVQLPRVHIDGNAIDIVEHQVGTAFSGLANVQKTGDPGML
jgi:hypothetical protein